MAEKILSIVRESRKRRKQEARDARRESQSRRRREQESASQKREGGVAEVVDDKRERSSAPRESSHQVDVPSQVKVLCGTVNRKLEDEHRRRGRHHSSSSDEEETLPKLVRLDAVTKRLDAMDEAIESLGKQQEAMSTITEEQRARLDIICTAIEAIRENQELQEFPGKGALEGKTLCAPSLEDQHDVVSGASLEASEENAGIGVTARSSVNFGSLLSSMCCKSIDESIWSLPLFVFLDKGHVVENFIAVGCVLLNVIVQVLFVIIVAFKFTKTEHALAGAQKWRTHVGHWDKYADSAGNPMAHRLCYDDLSLEISTGQSIMWEQATAYADTIGTTGVRVGPMLGGLCVLVWYLSQISEVLSSWKNMQALSLVPRTQNTNMASTDIGFELESIGRLRLAVVLLVNCIRIGLCAILSYSGTLWLASTRNIEEMLLNAVALQFILDIDEIIYHTCLPIYIRIGVENLQPLRLPEPRYPSRTLAVIFGAATYVAIFWHLEISLQAEDALSVKKALCNGPKDFVVAMNSATGIALGFVKNASFVPSSSSLMHRVTKNWIDGINHGFHMRLDTYDEFKVVQQMSLYQYVATYGECKNFDPNRKYILGALREAVFNSSLSSCDDMSVRECSTAPIVRFACPMMCGCNVPVASNYLLEGCPTRQCTLLSAYQTQIDTLPQEDIHRDILYSSALWHAYWSEYVDFGRVDATTGEGQWGFSKENVRHLFLDLGCEAYLHIAKAAPSQSEASTYFCHFDFTANWRRPLSVFCPETCSCNVQLQSSYFCPRAGDVDEQCVNIDVWGVSMADCSGVLSAESNPYAVFKCTANGYNGRNRYDYHDRTGMTWTIRWESAQNLDYGAIFVAGNISANGSSKWTLTSRRTHSIDPRSVHSFALSMDGSRVPQEGWTSPAMSGKHCSAGPLQITDVMPRLILTAIINIDQRSQLQGFELFATRFVRDLHRYSLGVSNNAARDTIDFEFPEDGTSVSAGSFIYLARGSRADFFNATGKDAWYDFQSWLRINGNDGIVLFKDGIVYDRYGVEETYGDGQDWEYTTHDIVYRRSRSLPTTNFSMKEWVVADNVSILGSFVPWQLLEQK